MKGFHDTIVSVPSYLVELVYACVIYADELDLGGMDLWQLNSQHLTWTLEDSALGLVKDNIWAAYYFWCCCEDLSFG